LLLFCTLPCFFCINFSFLFLFLLADTLFFFSLKTIELILFGFLGFLLGTNLSGDCRVGTTLLCFLAFVFRIVLRVTLSFDICLDGT
jgi:hypothetical protein